MAPGNLWCPFVYAADDDGDEFVARYTHQSAPPVFHDDPRLSSSHPPPYDLLTVLLLPLILVIETSL
jgi:hypothetical protein